MKESQRRTVSFIAYALCIAILGAAYGIYSERARIFPHQIVNSALFVAKSLEKKAKGVKPFYYKKTDKTEIVEIHKADQVSPGLTKITSMIAEYPILDVRVIDMKGHVIHRWAIDWFELWPDASHLPDKDMPKWPPGSHIHGAEIMANGDLVFNFEHLGLMRLDPCGKVVWRLPYRTHHSVFVDQQGDLWVSGQIDHDSSLPGLRSRPGVIEPTLLRISPSGEIMQEIRVLKLLEENGLPGLAFMTTQARSKPMVAGDILHLNDVEVFPASMTEGFFKAGDIMFSLRNINAVFVVEPDSLKIKYSSIGRYVRQHDPDFIDGNRISVFDNNNKGEMTQGVYSRIVIEDARSGELTVAFEGSKRIPFFTHIMGKHQWLSNGNLLVSASSYGRVFEVSPAGELVWEFTNITEPGYAGIVEEAERLAAQFDTEFFKEKAAQCAR